MIPKTLKTNPTPTNPKIKQQEAAVEMLRMLVKNGRARKDRLDAAINELNRLISENVSPAIERLGQSGIDTSAAMGRVSKTFQAIVTDVNRNNHSFKQNAFSEEITRLRKDQSELSNMLHKVPPGQECPELVDRILDLDNQVENIWTEKRFLARNENIGPQVPAHDQQVEKRSVEDVATKAELTVRIQKAREKRSKLQKKIADPKATPANKTKWEIELAQTNALIEEATEKRSLL